MEMYTIPQGFMINTLSENVVGESKNSVFQQSDTDSIKGVKLYPIQISEGTIQICVVIAITYFEVL